MAVSKKPAVILLDTNVWRYLTDSKSVSRLLTFQKKQRNNIRVAVAPTTAHEIIKLQDKELRHRLLTEAVYPKTRTTQIIRARRDNSLSKSRQTIDCCGP